MHLTMQALEQELQLDFYSKCFEYFQAWKLPKVRSEKLSNMFSSKRKTANKEAGTFKATASEGLSLCSIFSFMLVQVILPLNVCVQELNAYICLANVVDILQALSAKHCTSGQLSAAVGAFLKACKKAAWEEWCHPKFHWILHMGKHLSKWSMLPSTWVHERKHKIAKQYASLQRNTTGYDRSILLECLGHCQSELQQPNVFATATRLDKQGSASAKSRNFLADYMNEPVQSLATSHYAHLALGGSCCKGDVVLLKHARQVGEIYFHAEFNGKLLSLMNMRDMLEYKPSKSSCLAKKQKCCPLLVETEELACAVPYCHLKDDMYRIFIPYAQR